MNLPRIRKECLTLAALTALATSTQAQVLVNEFDYAQPGVDDKEFIELYVSAEDGVDLGEYSLELVDGVTGIAYATIALNSVSLAQGDYYVVCGSMAITPYCDQVAGTTAIDFIQDGEPDAIAVVRFGQIIDTISYAGNSVPPYTETAGTMADDDSEEALGLSRTPNGMDINYSAAEFGPFCITPGVANVFATVPCDGIYEINEIQDDGLNSPVEDMNVQTNGNIVTAVRSYSVFDGFYMEAPIARRDNDPDTSEGIFVRTTDVPLVQEGDEVNVIGRVSDIDMTMIGNVPLIQIISQGNPLPPAVLFDGLTPTPGQPVSPVELERFEGMRVSFNGIAVAPSSTAQVSVVAAMNRTFREPGIAYPGEPGLPVWDNNPEIFTIRIEVTPFADERIFAGQIVQAEGNLHEGSSYYLHPTRLTLGPEPALPRAVRVRQGDEIIVASQNMDRFYDDVDDPDTADLYSFSEGYVEGRIAKYSNHIRNTLQAPDIVALQSVETFDLVQRTADRIALDDPSLNYSAHLIDGPDLYGLNVAYLTRDDTVTVSSLTQLGADETDTGGFSLNWRPPLMLEAVYQANGRFLALTVINVQQDKLSAYPLLSTPRRRRFDQSISLAEKIQDLQQSQPDRYLMVLGDFGANEFTDGAVDVMGQVSGAPHPLGAEYEYVDIVSPPLINHAALVAPVERYSIILNGNSQLSDHILTNQNLTARVNHFVFSRGNADAPARPEANGNPSSRVADQDAPVIYLEPLPDDTDGDGLYDDSDNCTLVANPSQLDTNDDGFGNACDADLNDNCNINFQDLDIMKSVFFGSDPDADFNGDGIVNFIDLNIMKAGFFGPPGPSGLANACD